MTTYEQPIDAGTMTSRRNPGDQEPAKYEDTFRDGGANRSKEPTEYRPLRGEKIQEPQYMSDFAKQRKYERYATMAPALTPPLAR